MEVTNTILREIRHNNKTYDLMVEVYDNSTLRYDLLYPANSVYVPSKTITQVCGYDASLLAALCTAPYYRDIPHYRKRYAVLLANPYYHMLSNYLYNGSISNNIPQ